MSTKFRTISTLPFTRTSWSKLFQVEQSESFLSPSHSLASSSSYHPSIASLTKFTGNPRVLLLDEPSTGQDAGAKRILWKALKDIRADRAILLTTHSMEEAEALATSVAIIGTKMLATGTLSYLQEAHGGAYMIRAVRSANTTSAQVHEMINLKFEGRVSNYLDGHGQVSFCLPHVKMELGRIMRGMEELKGEVFVAGKVGEKVISDYTINGPTLEEVFMNVARENGHAGGV